VARSAASGIRTGALQDWLYESQAQRFISPKDEKNEGCHVQLSMTVFSRDERGLRDDKDKKTGAALNSGSFRMPVL